MKNNNQNSYWPFFIVGFLAIGITLIYWTVKSAVSMPVQESNTYMMKYQSADRFIHKIMSEQKAFDAKYKILLEDVELSNVNNNIHAKALSGEVVKLDSGVNSFTYKVTDKNSNFVEAQDIKFMLTQPHSRKNDTEASNIQFKDGKYVVSFDVLNAGRYTLQLRAAISDGVVGFSEIPAYLEP